MEPGIKYLRMNDFDLFQETVAWRNFTSWTLLTNLWRLETLKDSEPFEVYVPGEPTSDTHMSEARKGRAIKSI